MRHSIRGFITIFGRRLGPEFSRVMLGAERYLDRYIVYLLGGTLRLHKFWRGDDQRAPHDHPWWFITFPFRSYLEEYWTPVSEWDGKGPYHSYDWRSDWVSRLRVVKAWRFHFRPAKFRHIVIGRADGSKKPFWTLVISGGVSNAWGFWPKPDSFVPYKEWK